MIITVTINPAIDRTLEIDMLKPQGLNIVMGTTVDAGGKGINVSKAIKSLGGQSVATGFLGGETGEQLKRRLEGEGIQHDFVSVEGETRTNVKVFDAQSKQTTEFNEGGPALNVDNLAKLYEKLKRLLSENTIVVLSGSIPKTLDVGTYGELIRFVNTCGGSVFLDASGEAFKKAVSEKPDFIKPNRQELEVYFGQSMATDADLMKAGAHFLNLGVKHVLISLGHEGAFYQDAEVCYRMSPLKVEAHSSVGAGDAFVGAFVLGWTQGLPIETLLKTAVAASAGAVMTKGTKPVDRAWLEAHVGEVELKKL